MVNFEFIKGQRSGEILIYQGYLFNLDRKIDGVGHWRCRNRSCRVRCTISADSIISLRNNHNHEPLPDTEIDKMKVLSQLKNVSRASEEKTLNVVTRQLVGIDANVIRNLPRERSLLRTVQRERAGNLPHFIPTIPEIPESLWNNSRGEVFYQRDSGFYDINRHIIFISTFQCNI